MFSSATRQGMSQYGTSAAGDSWTWTSASTMSRSDSGSRGCAAGCSEMVATAHSSCRLSRRLDGDRRRRARPCRALEAIQVVLDGLGHVRDAVVVEEEGLRSEVHAGARADAEHGVDGHVRALSRRPDGPTLQI